MRKYTYLAEQKLNLFDRLACCFGVGDICLGGSTEAQNAEDDEESPFYILEGWGDEKSDGEVEKPIGDGGEGHACCTGFEGPDFCCVD